MIRLDLSQLRGFDMHSSGCVQECGIPPALEAFQGVRVTNLGSRHASHSCHLFQHRAPVVLQQRKNSDTSGAVSSRKKSGLVKKRDPNVPLPPLAVLPLCRHQVGPDGIGTQGRFGWSASAESPVHRGWTEGTSSNQHVASSENGHRQTSEKRSSCYASQLSILQ